MVVRIKSPHSLQRALNYNEKKVQKGQAECIQAANYLLPTSQLNFYEKMERMQDLMARNERTKKSNSLHISLNFDPSEKMQNAQLVKIADTYMEKIGFGQQPYLVYAHYDAGHPHIHIVTTNIQPDGKRIDTYNIGRNQSEKARKEIENDFGLIRAQGSRNQRDKGIKPVDVQRVQYGKSETKRSITNVLDAVINQFKYTSLAELNAVLKQYNVAADRGGENGIIYKSGGLQYRLLDEKGNKIGVPIKASSIYNKPTLKNLEVKFAENELLRQLDKKKLKTSIDWVLSKSPADLKAFITSLQKENIQVLLRENKDGLMYGITFIDFRTKSVFNGSNIGKTYSIAGILSKLGTASTPPEKTKQQQTTTAIDYSSKSVEVSAPQKNQNGVNSKTSLAEELMDAEKNLNRVAPELLKKKRKKRNKNL